MHKTFKLFIPDATFWGYLGISLIQSLILLCTGGIAALGVVVFFGLMALFIKAPVVIVLLVLLSMLLSVVFVVGILLVWIRLFLCTAFYFLKPTEGILQAFRATWQHSKDNWWRTLGFLLFLGFLLQLMLFPLFVIHGMVSTLTGSDLPGFKIIEPGILRTLLLVVDQILFLSGTVLIGQAVTAYGKTRLALDLMTRRLQQLSKRMPHSAETPT